jgi:hypothetical protein
MDWTFARVLYGTKNGLDLESIWRFLWDGYYFIPRTLFTDYYRAVVRVGDHDSLYTQVQRPFPDVLLAQRPAGRFALHLSGGFDSAILAKLYDREDADYVHVRGPESYKVRALAPLLQGTVREIEVTPDDYVREADELMPLLPEPYPFEDIVYAYIASKTARELGHTLVVAGDGGDGIFGGGCVGPYSRKSLVVWKTIDPNQALGLATLQPYMHTALYAWAQTTLSPGERARDKLFAQRYCRQLGMPQEVVDQKKQYWAGSIGARVNEKVLAHMAGVVEASDYRWIRQFKFPTTPRLGLPFRQYGLVKWLEVHYKRTLEAEEVRELSRRVDQVNAAQKQKASYLRRKQLVTRYCPRILLRAARRLLRRSGTGSLAETEEA